MDLPLQVSKELLSEDAPLALLADYVPFESLPTALLEVGPAFKAALDGNVAAARELKQAWRIVTEKLSAGLNYAELDSVMMTAKLAELPLLDTVYRDPIAGLYAWALVAIRENLQDPIAYPRHSVDLSTLLQFQQAVSAASVDELGAVARVKSLGVSNEDIGRWIEVSPQAVSMYDRGQISPRPGPADRLSRLGRLGQTFSELFKPASVRPMFNERMVPLLGGRTYRQALDDGFSPDVLIDVARRAVGGQPESEEGARYLAGLRATQQLGRFEAEHSAGTLSLAAAPAQGQIRQAPGRRRTAQ